MAFNTYAAVGGERVNIAERSATYAHRSNTDEQGAALVTAALAELRAERATARQKARPSAAFYSAPTAPAAPPAA